MDLIDRQDAIDAVRHSPIIEVQPAYMLIDKGDAIKNLIMVSSVQPERKTGRWEITHAYPHNVHCSECHKKYAQTHWPVWEDGSLPRNYCPNCGIKMEARSDG